MVTVYSTDLWSKKQVSSLPVLFSNSQQVCRGASFPSSPFRNNNSPTQSRLYCFTQISNIGQNTNVQGVGVTQFFFQPFILRAMSWSFSAGAQSSPSTSQGPLGFSWSWDFARWAPELSGDTRGGPAAAPANWSAEKLWRSKAGKKDRIAKPTNNTNNSNNTNLDQLTPTSTTTTTTPPYTNNNNNKNKSPPQGASAAMRCVTVSRVFRTSSLKRTSSWVSTVLADQPKRISGGVLFVQSFYIAK